MKILKNALAALLVTMLVSSTAHAGSVTLTESELESMSTGGTVGSFAEASSVVFSNVTVGGPGNAGYSATYETNPNAGNFVSTGDYAVWVLDTDIAVSSGDTFNIAIRNENLTDWNIGVGIADSDSNVGVTTLTDEMVLTPTEEGYFSIDVGSFSTIERVFFYLEYDKTRQTLTGGGLDPNGEFVARPVPEPGTIALLGAGMVAFAVARRRRKNS